MKYLIFAIFVALMATHSSFSQEVGTNDPHDVNIENGGNEGTHDPHDVNIENGGNEGTHVFNYSSKKNYVQRPDRPFPYPYPGPDGPYPYPGPDGPYPYPGPDGPFPYPGLDGPFPL